jgi:hypothetical protein
MTGVCCEDRVTAEIYFVEFSQTGLCSEMEIDNLDPFRVTAGDRFTISTTLCRDSEGSGTYGIFDNPHL